MKAVISRSHSWPLCYLIQGLEPIYYFPIFLSNIPTANSQHWFWDALSYLLKLQLTTFSLPLSGVSFFLFLRWHLPVSSCPTWSGAREPLGFLTKETPCWGGCKDGFCYSLAGPFQNGFFSGNLPSYQEALQEELRKLSQYPSGGRSG